MTRRIASVALAAFLSSSPLFAGDSPTVDAVTPDNDFTLQTPYHTEEEYIVGSVCRQAYEMLSFIADKKGEIISPQKVSVKKVGGGGDVSYRVTLEGARGKIDVTLHWPGSIWSSGAYVPLCQAAIAQLKLPKTSANAAANGNPLATLLNYDEKTIEAENSRISQWLTAEPDNALAHQQAALVLGTLAMKENSGWFWDPRDACNRLAAHLAVARSLNPGAELAVEGQLAECLRGLIDDTKKECADEIDHMARDTTAPKELAAWLRAARVRNSRDWRLIDKPESATPIEKVEFVRAYAEAVSSTQASAWLRKNSIPPRQDWGRLIIQAGCSVDDGHVYAMPSISSEFALMRETFPGRFQVNTMIDDLNELPGDVLGDYAGTRTIRVINPGMWSAYFQRLICQDIVETGYFLDDIWDVPDLAAQFDQKVGHSLSGLNLYPFVLQCAAERRQKTNDATALPATFARHPEWARDWTYLLPDGTRIKSLRYQTIVRSWYTPPVPSGTAYCAAGRLNNVGADLKKNPAAVDKLYAIAPLQFGIAEDELAVHDADGPTYDEVLKVMGPMVDYYLPALDHAANARNVALGPRISLEEKATALDPDRFWFLAKDLRQNGRDDDAADAYQQWYDKESDRVAVSNEMDWLVNYYFDHDQKDKALAIAKEGAEVYSYRGLQTMMDLMARMGKLDEAEDYGSKIKERYDDSTPLIVFYKKQVDAGNASYKAKFDSAIRGVFPDGLKTVTVSSFNGPPALGMQFDRDTPDLAKWGLSGSQIVVALDGFRVDNQPQYSLIWNFSTSPAMDFIVWDGKAYREIKVNQPSRVFGADLLNYTK